MKFFITTTQSISFPIV